MQTASYMSVITYLHTKGHTSTPWNKCPRRGPLTMGGQIPIEKHLISPSCILEWMWKVTLTLIFWPKWVLAIWRPLRSVSVLSLVQIHETSANTATIVPIIKHIYIDPNGIWAELSFFLGDMYSYGCKRTVRNFKMGSFEYYSHDHLTNLTWPGVGVSDPGSPVELNEINMHFFWRRV